MWSLVWATLPRVLALLAMALMMLPIALEIAEAALPADQRPFLPLKASSKPSKSSFCVSRMARTSRKAKHPLRTSGRCRLYRLVSSAMMRR